MSIRAKTKKRLLILLACGLVLGAGAGTLIVVQLARAEQRLQDARALGMEAFEAEDWPKAIGNLNKYVRKHRDDVDALYKLAVARRNLIDPRGAHIVGSIPLFRQVRDLDRGHKEARRHLLELYRLAGQSTEGLELAEETLAVDATNQVALKTKAFSEFRLRKFNEAYTTVQRATDAEPDDIELQMLTLAVMRQLEMPNEQLIARAEGLLEKDPDNSRFQLLLGLAHMLGNDRATAAEHYRRAAAADIKDRDFALIVVRQMDGAGLFSESIDLTARVAEKLDDDGLRRSLAHRQFQIGRSEEAMKVISSLEKVPSDLLGVQCMMLKREEKDEEAAQIKAQLEERAKKDGGARAWTYVFDLIDDEAPTAPSDAIATYQRAVEADPSNPYIRDMLARMFLRTQEVDQAIEQWEAAATLAPSWGSPFVGLAEVYASRNQPRKAMQMSQGALLRSPRNPGVVIRFIESMKTMIIEGKVADKRKSAEELLNLVTQFQEKSPGEPATFATYIRMLVVLDRADEAKAKLTELLADKEKLDRFNERGMLTLAQISTANKWGLDEQIMAALQAQHGESPTVAYAKAVRLAKDDREAALEYMRERVEAQPADAADWQAQWARLLEALDDPRALGVWKALGDKNVANPNVQQLILRAPSIQSDRPFVERTIDRLRKSTGENAAGWKIARARFLLSAGDEGAAQEAVTLLLPIVQTSSGFSEPHLLLAVGYEQVGNLTGAVEQLSRVRALQPDNPAVLAQLAKLQLRLNRTEETEVLANQILAHEGATPAQRRQAAGMLAELGQLEKALQVMEDGVAVESGDYLLAQLYLRANQRDKAIAELQKLMKTNISLPVVTSYATLQRALGQEDEAIRTLAHLKQLDLADGVRELALADYHEKFGEQDRAIEYLTEATKFDRTQRAAYRKLVDIRIEGDDVEAGLKTAAEAKKVIPGDPVFSMLDTHAALVERSAKRSQMKPILLAIIRNAGYRDEAVQILQMVDQAAENKTPASEVIRQVRQIAEQSPRFRELQYLLADFYAITGRNEEAATVASRAMRAFPNDPSAAERAFTSLARQGRWSEALGAAREWRSRQANNPVAADRAIARAYLGLNQPGDAVRQLEPYRQVALQNPQRWVQWYAIYGESLIAAGRVTDAENLLKTLISQHATWRRIWGQLAMNVINDARVSASWLERLGKFTPKDSVEEWQSLGAAWLTLGRRTNQTEFRDIGMEILVSLHESDPADIKVGLTLAVNAQQEGSLDLSEKVYDAVLKADPENAIGLNNLAMLYVDQGKKLDRALELAERVVELKPNIGSFHDTLAEVHLKRNEPDKAVASLKKAVEVDPDTLDWKVNLLAAHLAAGQNDPAKALLSEINRELIGREVTPAIREKINRLREKVAGLAATTN